MAVDVRAISSKKEIKQFIQFANDLYKDCPYYCPPLFLDEMAVFDRSKNPAMDFSDFQLFLAYKNGKIVGRIAALINRKANEAWNVKHVRFGWMDFIDDLEVSHALLDAVADWGKKQGMTEMNGPVGFTDWDHEGLLLEGYDYVAPLASLYNYPYYVRHMDAYGLTKDADWVEMLITCPEEVPDKMARVAKIVQERSHVKGTRTQIWQYLYGRTRRSVPKTLQLPADDGAPETLLSRHIFPYPQLRLRDHYRQRERRNSRRRTRNAGYK